MSRESFSEFLDKMVARDERKFTMVRYRKGNDPEGYSWKEYHLHLVEGDDPCWNLEKERIIRWSIAHGHGVDPEIERV